MSDYCFAFHFLYWNQGPFLSQYHTFWESLGQLWCLESRAQGHPVICNHGETICYRQLASCFGRVDLYMWWSEDVSERQGVKCRCCLAASHCQLSDLADCGQLNPTEMLTRSNLNLAIVNRMTIQKAIRKAVTIRGHCGQCRELYLATACPSACSSQSYHQSWCIFRFDLSIVWSVRALWGEINLPCINK